METIETKKAKVDSLIFSFISSGFQSNEKIKQEDLLLFLNQHSSKGVFEKALSDKLFQILNFDDMSSISIEEFINGYLQFEEDLKKTAHLYNLKLQQQREIYADLDEQCRIYKTEKLNEEGMCENAKVSCEITDIDMKRQLDGIKEIIIEVIYNEISKELHFKLGDINSNDMLNKAFEFKPTSRKDHFEFIMKGVNDQNRTFDIGRKVFPLTEIKSQEEYLVEIIIPEIEEEEKIAGFIHAKILLFWSDYKHYERLRKKAEKKLKKLTEAAAQANEYLRIIQEIYGDLTLKQPDLVIDFNNQKLMEKKGTRVNVEYNNIRDSNNYMVEFNNIREIERKMSPLSVEFNNSKEVVITTKTKVIKNVEISEKEEQNEEEHEKEDEQKEEKEENESKNEEEEPPKQEEEEQPKQEEEQPKQEEEEPQKEEEEPKVEDEQAKEQKEENVNLEMENPVDEENIISQEQNVVDNQEYELNANELVQQEGTMGENNMVETEAIDSMGIENQVEGAVEVGGTTENIDFNNTGNFEATEEYKKNIMNLVDQAIGSEKANIVHETKMRSSVNQVLVNEVTNKTVFSQGTLGVQVLPEKVNEAIIDSNVKTLPLIFAGTKVTYTNTEQNGNNTTEGYNYNL